MPFYFFHIAHAFQHAFTKILCWEQRERPTCSRKMSPQLQIFWKQHLSGAPPVSFAVASSTARLFVCSFCLFVTNRISIIRLYLITIIFKTSAQIQHLQNNTVLFFFLILRCTDPQGAGGRLVTCHTQSTETLHRN